jgi:hypothetical protein
MGERPVANVMEESREPQFANLRRRYQVWPSRIQRDCHLLRAVRDTERMFESCVVRPGIDLVCECRLVNVAEPLEQRRVYDGNLEGLEENEPADGITDNLSAIDSARLVPLKRLTNNVGDFAL